MSRVTLVRRWEIIALPLGEMPEASQWESEQWEPFAAADRYDPLRPEPCVFWRRVVIDPPTA